MTGPEPQTERRLEPRWPVPADHIAWAPRNATRTYAGWLSNVGASSVAFVAPTRERPLPGDTIELRLSAAGQSPRHRVVRVARTAPYDRFFSLIGCRSEPAEARAQG